MEINESLKTLVARSKEGDRAARIELMSNIETYSAEERLQLLKALPSIDAPEIWHALSGYLQDEAEAGGRRVLDFAVEAYLELLHLPASFKKDTSATYSKAQADEVLHALKTTVPQ